MCERFKQLILIRFFLEYMYVYKLDHSIPISVKVWNIRNSRVILSNSKPCRRWSNVFVMYVSMLLRSLKYTLFLLTKCRNLVSFINWNFIVKLHFFCSVFDHHALLVIICYPICNTETESNMWRGRGQYVTAHVTSVVCCVSLWFMSLRGSLCSNN